MAEVFRAESEGLQGFRKQVAIKRVLPHLSEKKRFIAMFLDEARISAQLTHSNCVQVFDIGVGDNAYFIVMEFVDGANLKSIAESLKKQGKDFPVAAAAFVCHEICKGLSYAHELTDHTGMPLNIVHRDMSPPNVLVTKYGEVKIVDFGLAKASSQLEKSEPGIIKGKFSYLSPEAAMGQEVGPATDIFAVGIILWELLAGQRLFLGETDFQTVKKVQQTQVPPISQVNRRVPPELERIVNKALARDVTARYATARELGQDLNRFLFAYGQAIGTFDIANIVQSTMRDKQRVRQPQGSIIDKLIEEALFEFTSLKEDGASQAGMKVSAAAAPLNPGSFVDPTNWAEEIAVGRSQPIGGSGAYDAFRASLPGDIFEQGNLSALEEQETPASSRPVPPRPTPIGGPTIDPASLLAPRGPSIPPPPPPNAVPMRTGFDPNAKEGGGNSATIGVVVLLVVAAAAGAAWFSGLIPHP
ncbi:MAG: serine/threonine protein kinase [Labilithrix sp.]|nr:serine/threonine protein kinase [Labilithrix sp.]MCW5815909.1 serine/threonine protein kinase [Labilithrix sp.]